MRPLRARIPPLLVFLILGAALAGAWSFRRWVLQATSVIDDFDSSEMTQRLADYDDWVAGGIESYPVIREVLQGPGGPRRRMALSAASTIRQVPPEVCELVARILRESDAGDRREALIAWVAAHPDPVDAMPEIISRFEDSDGTVREMAEELTLDIGPEVVPTLVEVVQSGPSTVRAQAMRALLDLQASDPTVIARAHDCWREETASLLLRRSALALLIRNRAATLDEIRTALRTDDRNLCSLGIEGAIGLGEEATPLIDDLLGLPDGPRYRRLAAIVGPTLEDHLQSPSLLGVDLSNLQRRRSSSFRRTPPGAFGPLAALAAIGPPAAAAIPRFEALLASSDTSQFIPAAWGLAAVGGDRESLLQRVRQFALSSAPEAPLAADLLTQLAPEQTASLLDALLDDLRHSNADERIHRLRCLEALGSAAAPASGDLERLVRDGTVTEQTAALKVIEAIGPAAAGLVPLLIERAHTGEDQTREAALKALCRMGNEAEPAVPLLTALLERATDLPGMKTGRRQTLVVALPVEMSNSPRSLGAPHTTMLQTPGLVRRRVAAEALVEFVKSSPREIPEFQPILDNPREEALMRVRALEALCHRDSDPEHRVRQALTAFQYGDEYLDLAAIAILQSQMATTPAAVEGVLQLLDQSCDQDLVVRPRLDLGMTGVRSQLDPEIRVRLALLAALAPVADRPEVRESLRAWHADLKPIDRDSAGPRRLTLREALRQRRDQRMMIERVLNSAPG